MQQVLSNLLNNAFKFTSEGEISFGYKVKDAAIEFFVSDTGTGISENHQSRIFDRFYQVENPQNKLYEGTGLGLAISKAYVEILGGEIFVESSPGKGSTFYFTIPYDKPENQFVSALSDIEDSEFRFSDKKKILVAEDIDSSYKLVSYFLKDVNAEVVRAYNGIDAIDKCQKEGDFDIVLMDVKMPRMDGFTASKVITESFPNLPIIAQTAYIDDKERAIESGCIGFLSKPYDRKKLISTISQYLK